MANGRINRFVLALLTAILLVVAPVSPALAEEPAPVLTPTFTFAALPLPTPTYGTGELAIQRTSAPDATGYQFTATIMGNGVFIGTNNSRTSMLNTDPLHGGASTQYVICVPETVMINVTDSTGAVVASLPAGANQAGSKDLRSCPEGPSGPPDADGDKVPDDGTDKCLGTPAGTVVDASGCAVVVLPPDADGDNVPDDGTDKCVDQAGPASNGGCPIRDTDGDGVLDDVDNCKNEAGPASNNGCPEVPATCRPGMGWKDANDNGKIDEGECVKRTTPGAGPPAVVNPPAVPTPVVAPHEPVSPVAATPPADESPVGVVVPDQSVAVVSEVDATNGRGVTAETAAVGTSTSESAVVSPEGRLGFGLAGLAILLAVTVWWLRPSTFE